MRPKGVYEIVNVSNNERLNYVGSWVTFSFILQVGTVANLLYTKQHNDESHWGRWLSTSKITNLKENRCEIFIETKNTTYTLERVL